MFRTAIQFEYFERERNPENNNNTKMNRVKYLIVVMNALNSYWKNTKES